MRYTVSIESELFVYEKYSTGWRFEPFIIEDWDYVPVQSLDNNQGCVHLYGRGILRPFLKRLKEARSAYPEFTNQVALTITLNPEDPYEPSTTFQTHWPALHDSYEDVNGEDLIAFYTKAPTTYTAQVNSSTKVGELLNPAHLFTHNPQRVMYTGADIQPYINGQLMDNVENIYWSVKRAKDSEDECAIISGSITFSQYKKHPLYEILQDNKVLGQGEPCQRMEDGSEKPIRSMVDLPPMDITLVYTSPLGFSSSLTLLGVEFQSENSGVSNQDLASSVHCSFRAKGIMPLREVIVNDPGSAEINLLPLETFSWQRPRS